MNVCVCARDGAICHYDDVTCHYFEQYITIIMAVLVWQVFV